MRAAVLAWVPFAACSCGIDVFDVTVKGETTVEKGSLFEQFVSSPLFSGFNSFDIAETNEFKNQGVRKEDVDSVKLKSFSLKVKSPAAGKLDFIDEISFFAETEGVEKRRIAHKAIPDGLQSVDLDLDPVELKPYVTAAHMEITTGVSGKRPPDDTTIEAVLVFTVDVNVAGAAGRIGP